MKFAETSGISFPGLGLEFDHVPGTLNIFGMSISLLGIFCVLGAVLWIFLTCMEAKRTGQKQDEYLGIFVRMTVAAIIGARAAYVVFNFSDFVAKPYRIFLPSYGGMSEYGAVLAGFFITVLYSKFRKISMFKMLDTLSVYMFAGLAVFKLGDFFMRKNLGSFSTGLFSMRISLEDEFLNSIYKPVYVTERELTQLLAEKGGRLSTVLEIRSNLVSEGESLFISVHPLFLYEIILLLVAVFVIKFYKKKAVFEGEIFYFALASGAVIRFMCSFFGPTSYEVYIMPLAAGIAAGSIVYYRIKEKNKKI